MHEKIPDKCAVCPRRSRMGRWLAEHQIGSVDSACLGPTIVRSETIEGSPIPGELPGLIADEKYTYTRLSETKICRKQTARYTPGATLRESTIKPNGQTLITDYLADPVTTERYYRIRTLFNTDPAGLNLQFIPKSEPQKWHDGE